MSATDGQERPNFWGTSLSGFGISNSGMVESRVSKCVTMGTDCTYFSGAQEMMKEWWSLIFIKESGTRSH